MVHVGVPPLLKCGLAAKAAGAIMPTENNAVATKVIRTENILRIVDPLLFFRLDTGCCPLSGDTSFRNEAMMRGPLSCSDCSDWSHSDHLIDAGFAIGYPLLRRPGCEQRLDAAPSQT